MLYRGPKAATGWTKNQMPPTKPVSKADAVPFAVPLLPTASQVSLVMVIDRFHGPCIKNSQSSKLMIEPCSATKNTCVLHHQTAL